LDEDQRSTLQSFVEPTQKFFEEVNNAALNDETGQIPDKVTKGLAELGAFGLQAPQEYNGLGVNNTQYARLVEIVGAHDLGVGTISDIPSDFIKNCIIFPVDRYLFGLSSVNWIQR
jgi:very long chain acyl-CoA dehydrogenase